MAGWRGKSSGIGWLTGLSVATVIAINLAGVGSIAVARRGALDEAERDLRLKTSASARAMESLLASSRADLAFLTGSPVFFGLSSALASRDPREARWRRLEAEGALLLFLRTHIEVTHLLARSDSGNPLVEAARRGGVPVLWRSPAASPLPAGRRGVDPAKRPITGAFTFGAGPRSLRQAATLEATVDAAKLLSFSQPLEDSSRTCLLKDAEAKILAGDEGGRGFAPTGSPDSGFFRAEATVETEGWSAPAPWRLICSRPHQAALAWVEPVATRYRTTLLLNVAAMSLALLLGAFAIHQARRREMLEARSREEVRIRELERQLFHAERLGTVGRLAAGIAHEINNPLEGISNYLSLAREDLARGNADSAGRRLDGVQEGLRRAEEIVRRVLAHADPSTAPTTPLDLRAVLGQSLEFVRSREEFRSIRFTVDLPEAPLMIRGSPAMLGQIFLNLLLNACEAQPGGGEVQVTARRQEGRAVAEIADRGPGVPPSETERIFEPFYSTKHSTGLGLSVCYSIARQHGADLGVVERAGGGAAFRMTFPSVEDPDV